MIGVSVATLRNWEQGRRHSERPAQRCFEWPRRIPKRSGRRWGSDWAVTPLPSFVRFGVEVTKRGGRVADPNPNWGEPLGSRSTLRSRSPLYSLHGYHEEEKPRGCWTWPREGTILWTEKTGAGGNPMASFKATVKVQQDGKLSLDSIPFRAGESILVVLEPAPPTVTKDRFPLRRSAYQYKHPFEPAVDAGDWDALR